MRNFLRRSLVKRKLLKGGMTDMELRMWCIENCDLWGGYSLAHARTLYQFVTASHEELKELQK